MASFFVDVFVFEMEYYIVLSHSFLVGCELGTHGELLQSPFLNFGCGLGTARLSVEQKYTCEMLMVNA